MAAITIDSPRWREGWGENLREGWGENLREGWGEDLRQQAPTRPALQLVGAGSRRPDAATFRRRRLAVLLSVVVLLALAVAAFALSRPASAGAVPQGPRTHVVEAGETYWSIAAEVHERGDLRTTVDALIDANDARALLPGDVIDLPR